jgi:tetratricopeptide (TPR) repeat protein
LKEVTIFDGAMAAADGAGRRGADRLAHQAAEVRTLDELAGLLRALRRRHARQRGDGMLTYREVAARTGWSLTAVGEYFSGRTLPPTDRLDVLVSMLRATPAEQGALATARDRVEELRRADRAVEPAAPRTVPRQLPAIGHFVGRDADLARLSSALDAPVPLGAARLAVLGGIGGIGKTWLALAWAHRNRDRFPDGQFYVDLRGFDPSGEPAPPGPVVRSFLVALGVVPAAVPADLDAQTALYRSLAAGRRLVVVLDNAADAAQVTPLLPGGGECVVLVTSRRRLDGLATAFGARTIEVSGLTAAEGLELLGRHLGRDRVAAEPQAAADLLLHCGLLPLAVAVVGACGAGDPAFRLAAAVDEMRDASTRLDALGGADLTADVRAVLSWSYLALPQEAAASLGLLAIAPVADLSLAAAAALLGLPEDRARRALRPLRDAYLVQSHLPGRYRMHDLIHLYAAERAQRDLPAVHRTAALRRLVDFYLHTAYAGDRHLAPARPPIALEPPVRGSRPVVAGDAAEALAWFDAEHLNLLAAQVTAAAQGWPAAVWQLAWSLNTFHNRRGHPDEQVAVWRLARSTAGAVEPGGTVEPGVLSLVDRWLGHAYGRAGRWDEAERHLGEALTLAGRAGDVVNQAHTCHRIARLWEWRGEDRRALGYARKALQFYRRLDNPAWIAQALNAIGWYLSRLGQHDEARENCRAALALHRSSGYTDGEAATLHSLGWIEQQAGDHRAAIGTFRQALVLFRDRGDFLGHADTLERLAGSHAVLEQADAARRAWREAESLYRAQHRTADAARVRRLLTAGD